jgi:uncharacterized damage-inducible protein DinB
MSILSNPAHGAADAAAAAAYVQALAAALGDQEPLHVLAELPAALKALTRGLPQRALRTPEAAGKWSIVEVVQHLADSEVVFAYRLRKALTEDAPRLEGFDQDVWASRLRYRDVRIGSALALLRPVRAANLRLLRALDADDLERTVVHAERGRLTVADMLRQAAGHDMVHRAQIERIGAAMMQGVRAARVAREAS